MSGRSAGSLPYSVTESNAVLSRFAAMPALGAGSAWLALLCYSLWVYLDFSAYCDIAIGLVVAVIFGIPFFNLAMIVLVWSQIPFLWIRHKLQGPKADEETPPGRSHDDPTATTGESAMSRAESNSGRRARSLESSLSLMMRSRQAGGSRPN